jgi:hypothetical protein
MMDKFIEDSSQFYVKQVKPSVRWAAYDLKVFIVG